MAKETKHMFPACLDMSLLVPFHPSYAPKQLFSMKVVFDYLLVVILMEAFCAGLGWLCYLPSYFAGLQSTMFTYRNS